MRRQLVETGTQTRVSEDDIRDPLCAHMFNGLFSNLALSGKTRLLNRAWRKQIDSLALDYKQLLCYHLGQNSIKDQINLDMELLTHNVHFKEVTTRVLADQKDQLSLWERLFFINYYNNLTMKYMNSEDAVKAIILLEPAYASALVKRIKNEPGSLSQILRNENSAWAKLLSLLVCEDVPSIVPGDIHHALQEIDAEVAMKNTAEDQLFLKRLSDSIHSSLYPMTKDLTNFKRTANNVYKNLAKIDFSGSNNDLNGLQLSYSGCNSAVFNKVSLVRANFIGTNLQGAKLRNANLSLAQLVYAKLSYTDFSNVILNKANLSYTTLRDSTLPNAQLAGAKLAHASLSHVNLNGANLGKAILSNADCHVVGFVGANLKEADLKEATSYQSSFLGANLESANVSLGGFCYTNFSRANLQRANLNRSGLLYSNFTNTNLSGADLSFTNLAGSVFGKTVLENTNLNYAILIGAQLDDHARQYAKEHGAILTMTDLAHAFKSGQLSFNVRFLQKLCFIATSGGLENLSERFLLFNSLPELIEAIERYRYDVSSFKKSLFSLFDNTHFEKEEKEQEQINELLSGLTLLNEFKFNEEQAEHSAPTMHWNKP